jgi:preprotein translocase subunit SecB
MSEPATAAPAAAPNRQILLQRIYLKDASVEVPLAPQVFTRAWTPQVDVQVGTTTTAVNEGYYQVMLTLTVTAKLGEDNGFLVEVHQAGIFQISGFPPEELQAVLAAYCPNIVFPFAREAVAELVQRAGFPPILLQPINFEGLYAEHLARGRGQTANIAAAGSPEGGLTVQ